MTAVPQHMLPNSEPRQLLTLARQGIDDAVQDEHIGQRYAVAHLAALRAASAILKARATPVRAPGQRITSVWHLLAAVAPELGDWAAHYASSASKRAAAEAGIANAVTARDADEACRAASQFIDVVEGMLL